MVASARSRSWRHTWAAVAIAPALIIGLRGMPDWGSRLMALKESPDGSTPTFFRMNGGESRRRASPYMKGLEIDWIVKAVSPSPTA